MSPAEQAAVQQFENQRTHIAGAAEFVASQRLFWEERTNKKRRSPTTPMQSGGGTPTGDHNAAPSGAAGPDKFWDRAWYSQSRCRTRRPSLLQQQTRESTSTWRRMCRLGSQRRFRPIVT